MLKTGQVYKNINTMAKWLVQENGMKCINSGKLRFWGVGDVYKRDDWKQTTEESIKQGKLVLDKEHAVKKLLKKLCA